MKPDCEVCKDMGFVAPDDSASPCPACWHASIEAWLRKHWAVFAGASLSDLSPAMQKVVRAAMAERRGLYIWGGVGVGKTHLLVAVMRELAATEDDLLLWTYQDMLDELRRDYDRMQGEGLGLLAYPRFAEVRVLLLDDIGRGRTTAWVSDRVHKLLDERNRNGLVTWFSSNYSLPDLARRLNSVYGNDGNLSDVGDGDTVVSRIAGGAMPVQMTGKDRRLKGGA